MSYNGNNDFVSAIKSRREGQDVLSWIEKFGLYLLDADCKPHITFREGEHDFVLVLRIRNKLGRSHTNINTISTYLCYFNTTDEGNTRFCVNASCDHDVNVLCKLMEEAKWKDMSTRNWWNELFGDLKHPIDKDLLRRPEVLVSNSLNMNMMDFVEELQKEISMAISNLAIDNSKISKVCIVEQYALALPLRYAISQIFPTAKYCIYSFVWKEQPTLWLDNSSRFHVSGKLLYTQLSTSPQLSIGEIIKLGKSGITITLPLSKGEDEIYSLPSTPIVDNSNLKWYDVLKDDVKPDYMVDNVSFKRVGLSIFPDGCQKLYLCCDNKVRAILAHSGNGITANVNSRNELKEEASQQKPTVAEKPITNDSNSGGKSTKGSVWVIDTNVFLDRPNIIDYLPADCKIGLSAKIIDEIDNGKSKSEELKRRAVQAQKNILKTSKERLIFQEPNLKLLNGLDGTKPDNKILAIALTLREEGFEPTILTSDNGLLLSALSRNVETMTLKGIEEGKKYGTKETI